MGSLQALLDEQLSTVPQVIATELVRDKLKAAGHAEDEKLISSIVEQLLSSGEDASGDDEDAIEIESGEDIVLQFTDADTARVHEYAEKISETLPDLMHTVAEKAAGKMLRRYERDWAAWRDATEIQMDQFRFNLQVRWGKGFDALRILIELSRDIGTDFHRRARRSGKIEGAGPIRPSKATVCDPGSLSRIFRSFRSAPLPSAPASTVRLNRVALLA